MGVLWDWAVRDVKVAGADNTAPTSGNRAVSAAAGLVQRCAAVGLALKRGIGQAVVVEDGQAKVGDRSGWSPAGVACGSRAFERGVKRCRCR
jgi:hypothetical protein